MTKTRRNTPVSHWKLNQLEKGGVKRGRIQVSECMEKCRDRLDILARSTVVGRPHRTGMFLQSITCSNSGLQPGFGRPRA